MDNIILDSYYGDVVLVSGKCWYYGGTTLSAQTPHAPPLSAFDSCEDCVTSGIAFTPPSGMSFCMGDMHYLYGNPTSIAIDPTSASFNVDDNSSTNEIVWWTHCEGGIEYFIKYSQQEFAYTSGGKAINEVIVSASNGLISDTYTLITPQSGTLRNAGSWANGGVSGLGTGMKFNITDRIISSGECSAIISPSSHFGLFNIDVTPNSGFSNISEYGGALWYIWKKASTYGAGSINTGSSAGMDGIGLFLNGQDGYTARSDFEAAPSTLRESYEASDVSAVMAKLDELSTIDGTWDGDWDPLTQDPPVCP